MLHIFFTEFDIGDAATAEIWQLNSISVKLAYASLFAY